MKTVSSIVENYIKTKTIVECIITSIINLTSLSRNIMSTRKQFGKVKQGAVVMALKRLKS
jgi:hypothetical protein